MLSNKWIGKAQKCWTTTKVGNKKLRNNKKWTLKTWKAKNQELSRHF